MSTITTCHLCQKPKILKKSHITPEFLYKMMYDDKRRFQVLSTNAEKQNQLLQKGIYEKLLCEDCEQLLSKWERYASLLLNGGIEIISERRGNRLHLSEIDYRKFKLFQLSILWRASISTNEFFNNVHLGKHSDQIRKLIVSNDPGEPLQYGCLMVAITYKDEEKNKALNDLIVQPDRFKKDGHRIYRFIFGGFMWLYFVSSHKSPREIFPGFLNTSGEVVIFLKDIESSKYFKELAIELYLGSKI